MPPAPLRRDILARGGFIAGVGRHDADALRDERSDAQLRRADLRR